MSIKGLGRLPRLKSARRIKRPGLFKGPAPVRPEPITAEMPDRIKRAYYALCGEDDRRAELAWRFSKLLADNPAMTLPEALFYILLEERKISFSYQSAFDGGRAELGGVVVDFVLRMGSYAIAVLVNGDYWHTLPQQIVRDAETKEQVLGQFFEDLVIGQALEIWESTLLSCDRERAVDLLLQGVEVGRAS
jgi:hypothetical protein